LKATPHKGKKEVKPTSDKLCKMMKVKIDWQERAISCMKLFKKLSICEKGSRLFAQFIRRNGKFWCMPTPNEVSQVS
jgi:hypothetical protein